METNPVSSPSRLPFMFFGLIVGLLIAGLIWFFVNKDTSQTQTNTTQSQILALEITTPKENLATSLDTLTLRGNTGINATVTVTSSTETKILQTSENVFSTTVKLVEGKNLINITAYDPSSGSSQTQVREVLYLNEDLSSL